MIDRVLRSGTRIIYIGITAVGLWMALGGYPPPATGAPVQLGVGAVLVIFGLAGMIWPQRIRSGSGSGPD